MSRDAPPEIRHENAAASFHDVARLLAPRSVVVVGASNRPGNLGGVGLQMLRKFGYPGELFAVHPTLTAVGDVPAYPSIADMPEPPDLAILAIPAAVTPGVVMECAKAGVPHGIIWSGGFAEVGRAGRALQDELVRICSATGFTVLGPNCLGIIDTGLPLTATFAAFLNEIDSLTLGDISMVSQSGGLATMCHAMAQAAGVGFRRTISTGNEAVLTLTDFVYALAQDELTKVIAVYLEGVLDGTAFVAALDAASAAGKPVVVLKGGSTAVSALAATAHTGAIVGEHTVWRSLLDEHGAVQVQSLEELLDVSMALSKSDLARLPRGHNVAAVTFGGGMGVLAADQCDARGLAMPPLALATLDRLRPIAPPIASLTNPVDLTPQAYNDPRFLARLPDVLSAIADDPNIHAVLVQAGPMATTGSAVAQVIDEFRHSSPKATQLAWPLAPSGVPEYLIAHDLHAFDEPARAINVLSRLVHLDEYRRRPALQPSSALPFPWDDFVPSPAAGAVVPEHRCHSILAAAGVPVAAGGLATTAADADRISSELGTAVALKGISEAVTHRAAAGLVALDLRSADEVAGAYAMLRERADSLGVELDGVYVQAMSPSGVEVLVSALRDPLFGVMVSCAAGGAVAEAIAEVTLQHAPFEVDTALRMINRLPMISRLLDAGATEHLAAFLARFSQLVAGVPWERFVFEINPVRCSAREAIALDGLLIVERP